MSVPNRAEHPNRKQGDFTAPHSGSYGARPFKMGNQSPAYSQSSNEQLMSDHKKFEGNAAYEGPGGENTKRLSMVREEMKSRGMS